MNGSVGFHGVISSIGLSGSRTLPDRIDVKLSVVIAPA